MHGVYTQSVPPFARAHCNFMKLKSLPFLRNQLFPFAIAFSCGGAAMADNFWDGDGSAPFNWSDSTNWGSNTAPTYGTLTFGGSTGTTNTVDSNTSMNMLLWTGTSAWTLNNSGGAVISLYDNGGTQAKIENQSTGLVTINAPIDFAATTGTNRAEINAVNGDITFASGGTITASGSAVNELHFYGSGRTVTINSAITAGSRKLVIGPSTTDNNSVVLNAANSYSGNTEVNTGTVQVGNNTGLGTSAVYLGNGGASYANLNASLLLNTSGLTVSNAITTNKADTGGGPGSGTRTIGGNFTSGSSTFSGAISLNGGAVLTAGNGGSVTFSGVIQDGSDTGSVSRDITVTGSGATVVLSGNNTYSGKTSITGGATLSINSDSRLGTAPGSAVADQLTLNNGTLRVTAATQTLNANRGITLGASGGTIDTSTISGSAITTTIGGVIAGNGPITLKSTGNMSANGGSDGGLGIKLNQASNTFTGDVTITSGLVSYVGNGSFGNSANKIILNGGGLLDPNTNIALSRDIQVLGGGGTFRTWGSNNVTWSGAITGSGNINRTDGGTLTLSGNLSGYSGTFNNQGGTTKFITGANALGGTLTVSGGGEVTIENSATNTYSAINLNAATLRVKSNNNALGSATVAVGGNATFASQSGSSALTLANNFTISGTNTLSLDAGYANITLNGSITGSGTKVRTSSSGTLTLGGIVNMGSTALGNVGVESNGTMTLASSATVTAGTVYNSNTGILNLSGATVNTGTLSQSANGAINLNSGTLTAALVSLNNTSGVFTISGGTLNTQYLNIGNASNTSGRIVQTGGTVNVTSGGTGFRIGHWNNGAAASSSYNLSGGILDATGLSGNSGSAQLVNIGWDGQGDMTVGGGAGSATLKAHGIQLDANGNGGGSAPSTGNMTLTISANGIVEVGAGNIGQASTSDNIILNGGTLRATANSTWGATMTANTSTTSTLEANSGVTVNASQAISGAGALIKGGAGTVTLSGTNTFAGGLTISAGTLKLGSATGIPDAKSVTVSSGATFDFSGQGNSTTRNFAFTIAGTGVGGNGAMINSGAAIFGNSSISSITLADNTSVGGSGRWDIGDGTVGRTFNGGGFTLTKVGSNQIVFRPETVTNLAGVVVTNGIFSYESFSRTTAATATMTNTVSGGTLASYGTLSFNMPLVFSGGGMDNLSGTSTWTGTVALNSNTTITASNPIELQGVVSGSGVLTKLGGSTLTLTGTTNSYTGGTAVNAGTLIASSVADAGGSIGAYTSGGSGYLGIANGSTFRYTGTGTESTARYLWIDTGSGGTIEVTNAAGNLTFTGTGGNINKAFAKTGAGTLRIEDAITTGATVSINGGNLILAGANTYTGSTTVTSGTLKAGIASVANTSGAFGNNSAITMANTAGAILDITGFNTQIGSITGGGATGGNVTLGAATLTVGGDNTSPAAYAGIISGTGGVTKIGSGTQIFSGAGTWSGTTTVSAGTLEVQAKSGDVTYSVAQGATLRIGYSTGGGYSPGMTLNGNGVSDAAGLYLKRGITYQSNGGLLIQTAPTTIRTYGSGGNAGLQGFDVNSAYFLKTTAAASGSVVDSTVNVYTGSYGYRLQADSGSNNATGDLTINGVISGSGSAQVSGEAIATGLHKFGNGSLKLTGASTFAAGTSINDGAVILSGGDNRLPVATTVALGNGSASGKLILGDSSGAVNQTIAGLRTNGSGTSNAVVGGNASVSTLTINNSSTVSYSGKLGGAGTYENNLGLNKTGVGTLNLSGASTYTGPTSVTDGRMNVNGSVTSDTTVDTGAILGGDGSITGTVSLSGTLLPGQGGSTDRSLTINGNVTTNAGSILSFTVTSMASHDQLIIGGGSSIGLNNADLVVDFDNSLTFTELGAGEGDDFLAQLDSFTGTGSWFKLISGTTTGMFANVTDTMSAGDLSYFGLSGTQYTVNIEGQTFWVAQGSTYLVAIPEPRAALIGSIGLLMLLRRRRH